MIGNRVQIFSELVSLEAWHLPFTNKRASVGLHADVTFSTARLGGEADSPVRFKLTLKQAMLTVMIKETEPLVIDPASVARLDPAVSAIQKQRTSTRGKRTASGRLSALASGVGLFPRAEASVEASASRETSEETIATRKMAAIAVRHSLDGGRNNRWHFAPGTDSILHGKPWSAAEFPLMKIKDTRAPENRKIEATVALELTCLREDLNIFDIEMKDDGFLRASTPNRVIAAEAYIRNRLISEGLPAPNISDGFAMITLARANSYEGGW